MTTDNPNLEEFFKQSTLRLANFEKIGSTFLIIGYSYFIYVANLDIQEETNPSFSTTDNPESLLVIGEKLVLYGLIILWYVAYNRVYQINLKNSLLGSSINIAPFQKLVDAYLLSILSNIQRVDALTEISFFDPNDLALI